jgi:hypothetical protein
MGDKALATYTRAGQPASRACGDESRLSKKNHKSNVTERRPHAGKKKERSMQDMR